MIDKLPAVNATLNTIAFIFLCCGWRAIKRGDRQRHIRCMLAAVGASTLFLASYVTYHWVHGDTKFTAEGWPRRVYFFILATHVPLAVLMVPPILCVLWFAAKGRLDRHKRLARWTLPVWMYVSVTGVIIYAMLYHLYPPAR